jgi:hypothetical protein
MCAGRFRRTVEINDFALAAPNKVHAHVVEYLMTNGRYRNGNVIFHINIRSANKTVSLHTRKKKTADLPTVRETTNTGVSQCERKYKVQRERA